jgi:hypothetical protein
MRGFPWVEQYLPDGWLLTEEKIDDDAEPASVITSCDRPEGFPDLLQEGRAVPKWR